ncbi:MAG TPA: hypothetical protein VN729_05250 [Ktedonobacteraceae bacterium]|nr:hypothetical protein [Ktedonobacteraceae bacterium]
MNYLQNRACGARKNVGVACFAGYASKTGNTYTEKAREVGLAQEKTNNSQDLLASQNFVNTLDRPMV